MLSAPYWMIFWIALAACVGSQGKTCTIIPGSPASDVEFEEHPDCSFIGDGNWGGLVTDHGGGVISQMMASSLGCYTHERLLVVGCGDQKTLVVEGVGPPRGKRVGPLMSPEGKIDLRADTSIDELILVAKAEDYAFETDLAKLTSTGWIDQDFDPFCGCKLYYPESLGATE